MVNGNNSAIRNPQSAIGTARLLLAVVLCAALPAAGACGYRFSGGGALPGGAKYVSFGTIFNRSNETGLEGSLLNDIGTEFTRHGRTFSYGEKTADVVLSGEVLSVSVVPVTRKSAHTVLARTVTVSVSLKLTDKTGTVIWQEAGMSDSEAYGVTTDKAVTEQNKRSAVLVVLKRLAEKAYYRMTDNF